MSGRLAGLLGHSESRKRMGGLLGSRRYESLCGSFQSCILIAGGIKGPSSASSNGPVFCRNGTFPDNCKLLCQLTLGLSENLPGVAQLNNLMIKFATSGWRFCKIGRCCRTQKLVFRANQYHLSLRNNRWGKYLLWLWVNPDLAGNRGSARKLLFLGIDGGAPCAQWCDVSLKNRFGCALSFPTTHGFARVIM